MRKKLEAEYVLLLNRWNIQPGQDINDYGYWTGWKRRHWPAEIVKSGLRFYGCLGREGDRRLCFLLELTRGGTFNYRNLADFSRGVKDAIGEWPSRTDPHWKDIPSGSQEKPATGIAFLWRLVKPVNISFDRPFRQIGWMSLNRLELPEERDADLADLYTEGRPTLKAHVVYERKPALRRQAMKYWRQKMNGRLKCIACDFDFRKHYGIHGQDFIEMHHEVSVSRGGIRTRNAAQLQPVCSNCHRMIHRRSGSHLRMDKLIAMLKAANNRDRRS